MKKGIVLFMLLMISLAGILKVMELSSEVYQNTKSLERQLETNQRTEGSLRSLIDFEVDQMIVLDAEMTKEEMIQILGFQYHLQESETGMHNIVFVKDDEVIAYLHGYHMFNLNIPYGKYTLDQIESMTYVQHRHIYNVQINK